jgi:hypothetical protein
MKKFRLNDWNSVKLPAQFLMWQDYACVKLFGKMWLAAFGYGHPPIKQ